jgi:hypothetical protein
MSTQSYLVLEKFKHGGQLGTFCYVSDQSPDSQVSWTGFDLVEGESYAFAGNITSLDFFFQDLRGRNVVV